MAKTQTAFVALLRGINVGGKNKLSMKDLAEIFSAAGAKDVQTFIQSGNVIFKSSAHAAAQLPAVIASEIAKRFGYRIPVILRTKEQLGEVLLHNPYLSADRDEGARAEEFLHVMFLADLPNADRRSKLDPARSQPDEFIVRGQDIYLRLPNGVARSKLTNAYFDSQLRTVSTSRNWRTVKKLFALLCGMDGASV